MRFHITSVLTVRIVPTVALSVAQIALSISGADGALKPKAAKPGPTAPVTQSAPATPQQHIVDGDLTILGFTIGKPPGVPHCEEQTRDETKLFGPKRILTYVTMPMGADSCYAVRDGAFTGWAPATDQVNQVPSNKAFPPFVAIDDAVSVALNGTIVDGVRVKTKGLETQELALAALREKFGEPTVMSVVKLGNSYGATYDVVKATWTFSSGAILVFDGTGSTTKAGYITAKSAAFVNAENSDRHTRSQSEIKL